MNTTLKTVLALVFAILLFSWLLSLMPGREGFEAAVPEIDQVNYMLLAEDTKPVRKIENMESEGEGEGEGTSEDIKSRLAVLNGTSPSSTSEPEPDTSSLPAESMLNMSAYV